MNPIIKRVLTNAAIKNPQIASYQFFKEGPDGTMIPRDDDYNLDDEYLLPEEDIDPFNPIKLPLV